MFDSNNFTLSSLLSFQNVWPIKRKAVYTLVLFHIYLPYSFSLWESDWITTSLFLNLLFLILVNLHVVAGRKFYRLPPDKENAAADKTSMRWTLAWFEVRILVVSSAVIHRRGGTFTISKVYGRSFLRSKDEVRDWFENLLSILKRATPPLLVTTSPSLGQEKLGVLFIMPTFSEISVEK